ncbi:MAG: hypothetical protein EHM35_00540 [Planctomycetaceae bacterium]|nr:MAG: hypothetical protein EHM35_00540 [Planctomycetaceae bacterium]
MTKANYARKLKGLLQEHYRAKGIDTHCTDSATLTLFSGVPLTAKSKTFNGHTEYMTTFGPKEAERMLGRS